MTSYALHTCTEQAKHHKVNHEVHDAKVYLFIKIIGKFKVVSEYQDLGYKHNRYQER